MELKAFLVLKNNIVMMIEVTIYNYNDNILANVYEH